MHSRDECTGANTKRDIHVLCVFERKSVKEKEQKRERKREKEQVRTRESERARKLKREENNMKERERCIRLAHATARAIYYLNSTT
jgi:hypothetical protein